MNLSKGSEQSGAHQSYDWINDPSYQPTLAEVQEAQNTQEGKTAIHSYYRPSSGPERFEIWTDEYISELAKYLGRTLAHYDRKEGTVLEIGAGDGRLSGLLRQKMAAKKLGALVVATDVAPPERTYFPVETLSYEEALQKYEPTIAISSWMPLDEDWTQAMRATPSLLDYILIGSPKLSGNISSWQDENVDFSPIELHYLDALRVGQFSGGDVRTSYQSLTRGFRRFASTQTERPVANTPIR